MFFALTNVCTFKVEVLLVKETYLHRYPDHVGVTASAGLLLCNKACSNSNKGASIAGHVAGRGDAPRGLLPQGGAKITPCKKICKEWQFFSSFFLLLLLNYL
jgi:hypothetical protein